MPNYQHKIAIVNEKSSNKIAAAKYFMETNVIYVMVSITISDIITMAIKTN